jgi:recombination protein RecT
MNDLVTQQENSVKSLLAQPVYKKRFEEVLGSKSGGFIASIVQASRSSQLTRCEPVSVIAAAFTAATLDLPIDKNLGFAHIVPYAGKAQFQMGYKGYIQLALRTGQYAAMNDFIVNQEAFKSYDPITGELDIDREKLDEFSVNVIGYGFYFKLVSGFSKMVYWPKTKIEKHAARYSQAYRANKKDSPWFTDFNSMALKTIIINTLRKYGILSIQMETAMKYDQSVRTSLNDDEPDYVDGLSDGPLHKTSADKINDEVGGAHSPEEKPNADPTKFTVAEIDGMSIEELKIAIQSLEASDKDGLVTAMQACQYSNMPAAKTALQRILKEYYK